MSSKPTKEPKSRAQSIAEIVAEIPLIPVDIHQRYTIEQAAIYLRQSRAKTFELIKRGEIKTIDVDRRKYIGGSEIARLSRVPS